MWKKGVLTILVTFFTVIGIIDAGSPFDNKKKSVTFKVETDPLGQSHAGTSTDYGSLHVRGGGNGVAGDNGGNGDGDGVVGNDGDGGNGVAADDDGDGGDGNENDNRGERRWKEVANALKFNKKIDKRGKATKLLDFVKANKKLLGISLACAVALKATEYATHYLVDNHMYTDDIIFNWGHAAVKKTVDILIGLTFGFAANVLVGSTHGGQILQDFLRLKQSVENDVKKEFINIGKEEEIKISHFLSKLLPNHHYQLRSKMADTTFKENFKQFINQNNVDAIKNIHQDGIESLFSAFTGENGNEERDIEGQINQEEV